MKKILFLFLSILIFNLNAQLVAIDSLDLGVIYKPDEAKMRKIYFENISSDTVKLKYFNSTDYHQVFYYHGKKIEDYNLGNLIVLPNSKDSFEFNMKDLSWKLKKVYQFVLRLSYICNEKYLNLEIQTRLEMGRKLSFIPNQINLGKIDATRVVKNEFYIKNLSKDTLNYKILNHVINKKIELKPFEKKIIPIHFNYFKSSQNELKESKNVSYNNFKLNILSTDNKDFDYEIPLDFSVEILDSINPKIQLDSNYLDFSCKKGEDGNRMMGVRNIGKQPLLITNCSGSCGCIVPSCPRQPIMPGKKAIISIKYDTNRVGSVNKQVTVSCNDPETPHVIIMAKGEIFE